MSRVTQFIERQRGKAALSLLAKIRSTLPASLRAEWLGLEGEAFQQLGDFRRSHAAFLKSLRLLNSRQDPWRSAEISLRLGDTARQLEWFNDAIRWYGAAERHAHTAKSSRLALDATCGRAMALRGLGRYEDSLRLFSRLHTIYKERLDAEGVAYILWAMGTTERFAGHLSRANAHLHLSVSAYLKIKDASGLAYARCGWGGTLRMMGFAEKSRRLYAAAFDVFRRQNDRFGMAYSSCGQANGLRMAGRLAEALPFMKRAESGYRALGLSGPLAFVLWSRAQLLVERGDWKEARRNLRESEKAFRSSKDPRGLVYVQLGFAELARAQGMASTELYLKAARAAHRNHLPFERAHALIRAGKLKFSAYRSLGVSISQFSRYRSLP